MADLRITEGEELVGAGHAPVTMEPGMVQAVIRFFHHSKQYLTLWGMCGILAMLTLLSS